MRKVQSWFGSQQDSVWLLGPVTVYLAAVAMMLLPPGSGLAMALLAAALLFWLGRRISADTMLSLYRAEPIAPGQGASLRTAVEALSARAGLASPPALAIVPSLAVGAFSAGQQPRMALLLTEGLLRRYSLREIAAIAAHEIAHMRAGDLAVFSLADATTRLAQGLYYTGAVLLAIEAIAWLAGEHLTPLLPILLLLLAPALNSQLQLRLPRQREYDADQAAACLLGDRATLSAIALTMEPNCGSVLDDFRLPVPQRRAPLPSPLRAHLAGSERAHRLATAGPLAMMPPLIVTEEPLISLAGVGPIEMRPRNRWPGLWF